MLITILGKENASGLEKDKNILTQLMSKNNILSEFRSVFNYTPLNENSDLIIHLEISDNRYFGRKNVLIPNQEWFKTVWKKNLKVYDAIFCKSYYAFKIFKKLHRNVKYIGFTSEDAYLTGIDKQKQCFHASGFSKAKGTQFILDAWYNNLPNLHLISPNELIVPSSNNIIYYKGFFPEADYNQIRNRFLIHIYPSQIEGFGHCINEAMSSGAVVITVDYPPMNELVSDFLVPPSRILKIPGRLGEITYTDSKKLRELIRKLMKRDDLEEIGKSNRQKFLESDAVFKEKIINEIKKL